MIISRKRRYIFVHIPKTGGTALTLALEARACADDVIIGDTPKALARRGKLRGLAGAQKLRKHATLADLDGLIGPDEWDQFLCFTLVRNPWDRMVSYYHWLRDQRFDHPAVHLAQSLGFSDFLHHPSTIAAQKNWPAPAYMRDSLGQMRGRLFVRLEHLAQDIAPLEQHLGFGLAPLARHNASARGADYRSYYSARDADLIADICAADIAQFGYGFE